MLCRKLQKTANCIAKDARHKIKENIGRKETVGNSRDLKWNEKLIF